MHRGVKRENSSRFFFFHSSPDVVANLLADRAVNFSRFVIQKSIIVACVCIFFLKENEHG